jgi:hypothetical protein
MLTLLTVEAMLLIAVRDLTRSINLMNSNVERFVTEAMDKLRPLLKSIETAKPFLDVFNTLVGIFFTKPKRRN